MNTIEVDSLPTWPVGLPIAPLLAEYTEPNKSLVTSVTSGNKSKIVRKTSSRTQRPLTVAFNLSASQVELFETFFYSTLEGGAIRFTFTHPRTLDNIECSFDPGQETAFTITPQDSMSYFKVTTNFIVWD